MTKAAYIFIYHPPIQMRVCMCIMLGWMGESSNSKILSCHFWLFLLYHYGEIHQLLHSTMRKDRECDELHS